LGTAALSLLPASKYASQVDIAAPTASGVWAARPGRTDPPIESGGRSDVDREADQPAVLVLPCFHFHSRNWLAILSARPAVHVDEVVRLRLEAAIPHP